LSINLSFSSDNLIVDTGSSNTWIGANSTNPYVKTATSVATNDVVGVTYGSGSFQGMEFVDQVTLAPGLVIKNQSIGVSEQSQGFDGVDGILGVGPAGLTVGTLPDKETTAIPTVIDNLATQVRLIFLLHFII
jgi:cathepsin E